MKQRRASTCGVAMAICLAMATNGLCGTPWLEGFAFRQMLTVTNLAAIAENQVNFPLPVKLHAGNFNFNHANPDGLDVRFTADDGVTPLSFERERHDSAAQQAEYWVKLPQLSSGGQTTFYLYSTLAPQADASTPADVWNSDYLFVFHLAQQNTNVVQDSTAYGRDGTNANGVALGAAGCVNGAAGFLNSAEIRLPVFSRPARATFEVWFKPQAHQGRFYSIFTSGVNSGYALYLQSDGTLRSFIHTGTALVNLYGLTGADLNEWNYAVDIWGDTAPGRKVYLNGELDNSLDSAGIPYPGWNAERTIGGSSMNSILDEIRLSSVARSAAWIRAQNAAIRDRLLAYGEEETRPLWLDGYRYRRRIAVTNSAAIRSDLTDFPVLVKLTDANFNFYKSSADGADVRFTMSDGVTPLSFERERHSRDTRQAEYWVRMPRLYAGTADAIYLYHSPAELPDASDPAAVWDSNYLFVHHLTATGGASLVFDSTANARTGTAVNVTLGTEGFIAGGVGNDGVTDHRIRLLDTTSSRPWTATFEVLFKKNSPDTLQRMIMIHGVNYAYWLGINATNHLQSYVHQGNGEYQHVGASLLAPGQWHYAVGIYSSWAGRKIYANGELDADWNNLHVPYGVWWVYKNMSHNFNGEIDEVRLSSVVRSAAWIHAQHVSMRDQLLEVGAMEFTDQGSILLIR